MPYRTAICFGHEAQRLEAIGPIQNAEASDLWRRT